MEKNDSLHDSLFTREDLRLFEFPQIFSTSSVWLEKGWDKRIATYDVVIRDLPKNRNFLLLGGTEEIVTELQNWKYTEDEITYLLKLGIITEKFADYLRKFKFTCDVYAMPEGTAFFPGEPVLRVTGPIIEGNLVTLFIINAISGNTAFLSKFIRSTIAGKGKRMTGPGGIRAHSFESGMKASRAAYIAGFSQVLPAFYRKYRLEQQPPIVVAYHAYIKSFPTEIEAMREITEMFPVATLMVDTYDFNKGVDNAITVALELKQKNKQLVAIMIDSGDLYQNSVQARTKLDDAGLQNVKIVVASNLDEFKIQELVAKGIPADTFIVATEAVTVADDPKVETVYKMTEIQEGDKISYLSKLTPGKLSLPGKKQVFRVFDTNGKIEKDVIGLDNENLGELMLVQYLKGGKAVKSLSSLEEIKSHVLKQIQTLPDSLKKMEFNYNNKLVEVSDKVNLLIENLKKTHIKK